MNSIIKWGKVYLEKTLKPIKSDYQCIAFRAGGYCIQPHEELFSVLRENGIIIDSSVAMKQYADGVNKYDYRKIKDMMGWWINPSESISNDRFVNDSSIFEVPVWYKKNNLWKRLTDPNNEKSIRINLTHGSFIGQEKNKTIHANTFARIISFFKYSFSSRILSVDSIPFNAIIDTLHCVSKAFGYEEKYVAIIGHPKLISDIWISNFRNLLEIINESKWCNCITMTEISKQICSFMKGD